MMLETCPNCRQIFDHPMHHDRCRKWYMYVEEYDDETFPDLDDMTVIWGTHMESTVDRFADAHDDERSYIDCEMIVYVYDPKTKKQHRCTVGVEEVVNYSCSKVETLCFVVDWNDCS